MTGRFDLDDEHLRILASLENSENGYKTLTDLRRDAGIGWKRLKKKLDELETHGFIERDERSKIQYYRLKLGGDTVLKYKIRFYKRLHDWFNKLGILLIFSLTLLTTSSKIELMRNLAFIVYTFSLIILGALLAIYIVNTRIDEI